jgi:hypothetical protein
MEMSDQLHGKNSPASIKKKDGCDPAVEKRENLLVKLWLGWDEILNIFFLFLVYLSKLTEKPTTHFHRVSKLRMHGAISPPYVSWRAT